MMKAAIYCRVSTDKQEQEGTSLQTQLEACLKFCRDKGYDLAHQLSEKYSGLSLERPELGKLRQLVRDEQIDVVVVYCLDRLSRDPVHGVMVIEELEKHHVILEAVIETIETSEVGRLISYIRGFASKLEAQKIRERTMRGKKAKAKQGQITCGGSSRLYGYDYISASQKGGGRRIVNVLEAKWVKQIYQWLVNDGMSTSSITYRLRASNVPTKHNRLWCRAAVLNILKNPAYTGRTYAFTTVNGKPFAKKQEEWIEIPGVTPPIIDEALFHAAQKQLSSNRDKSVRNVKREYLLRGHIYCHHCGRAYYGCVTNDRYDGNKLLVRRYRCSGKLRMVEPVNRCIGRSWKADKIEASVWQQIERVLDKPETIIGELGKQRHDANKVGVLESELQNVERQLKALDRDQEQLLQWALKGFPEETVIAENKRINEKRINLQGQKAELDSQIKASREDEVCLPKLERFVELMREKLFVLDFEKKRMALDMLDIKVWVDGQNLEVTGSIPIAEDTIVTTPS